MASKDDASWQIETLFKRAFERTKDRFLGYLFAYLIGIGLFIALVLVTALVGGLIALLYFIAKVQVIAILLGALGILAFIFAVIYLASWMQLTVLKVVTDAQKITVNEALKTSRTLVPGFIVLNILTGLFIVGLFPFSIFTLFILFMIWGVWGSMAGFVYLYHKQPKGIKSLWLSKQMVGQNFWGIVGRILIIFVAFYALIFLLNVSKLAALTPVLSFIFTPFIISYVYEIYQNLSVPKSVKVPRVWVGLSVVGWAIALLIFVVMGTVLVTIFGQLIQSGNKKVPSYPIERQVSPPRLNYN